MCLFLSYSKSHLDLLFTIISNEGLNSYIEMKNQPESPQHSWKKKCRQQTHWIAQIDRKTSKKRT